MKQTMNDTEARIMLRHVANVVLQRLKDPDCDVLTLAEQVRQTAMLVQADHDRFWQRLEREQTEVAA